MLSDEMKEVIFSVKWLSERNSAKFASDMSMIHLFPGQRPKSIIVRYLLHTKLGT